MSTTRAVWLFLFVLTGIRLALLSATALYPDEAYYWLWSQRPALSYFSKGPGVAFAIRSSTAIFGDNEFGVRFWSPILAAGTSLLLYYFAQRIFSAAAAFWTVIVVNVLPIFNIGGVVMTIDPLSIFFWVAALYTFWLALERSPNFSWYWPLTGLLIGLGFLCKYTNALQLISIVIVLALVPRLRREFARPNLYLLLSVFLICTLPPIIWNAQRNWVTLAHLRSRASLEQAPGFHPLELLSFWGMHFVMCSPLLFLGLAWAVIAKCRRMNQQFKSLYLLWFGLPVFAFYTLLSFNKAALANWDALALPSFGVLAVSYWRERAASRAHVGVWAGIAFGIGLLMSLLAVDSDILRSAGFHLPWREPSDRMRGWISATAAVEKSRNDFEAKLGQRVFLIADERERASEISFYLRDKRVEGEGHPPVYITESQDIQNQFSFWPRYDEFVAAPANAHPAENEVYTEEQGVNAFIGRSALYIQGGKGENLPRNIRSAFQRTEHLATIEVRRFGRVVRELQVYACYNYRTLPL